MHIRSSFVPSRLMRLAVGACALALVMIACSSNSSTPPPPAFSYWEKCNARCGAVGCSSSCDAYGCNPGFCASDCARLTDKLPLACAQCLIEQTVAGSTADNASACARYRIGQTTDPACQIACGTGSGVDGG